MSPSEERNDTPRHHPQDRHEHREGNSSSQDNHEDRHSGDHENHDHSAHHEMMIRDFRRRFVISLVITLPVLALSPMIQQLLGFEFTLLGAPDRYLLFALSTVVFFYGGWPFLTGLVDELSNKQPGMMTLITVAITVAWGYSSATTFGVSGSTFFWELVTLIDVMLLGHWIEMKSVLGASRSLRKLVEMMPSEAHLLTNGNTTDVQIDELNEGNRVLVHPGEKIPVDGVIVDGESQINESMVTGEARPVSRNKDDRVIGGTINGNGSLTVEVEQVGKNAYLSKVINMVRDAQSKKSRTQNLADRIARWLTVIALAVGFGTLAVWLLMDRPFVFALERMATVMVITCPHALGLAVPLVVAISITLSAQNGLLIRNRTAFENSRKISLVAFDKTGTLTKGNFGVTRFGALNDSHDDHDILRLAGALEQKSEHPLAIGIMEKVREHDIDLPEARDFNALTGLGIEARVEGRTVRVVSPEYMKNEGIKIPDKVYESARETVVFVLVDDQLAGFVSMADEIREQSYDAVKSMREAGIKVYMMTGDNEKVARSVSEELGLDGYFAGILPDQKLEKIKEFQNDGEFVAMTGDGINDAPALAAADVGIAVGSGTDVAAETADIILVESNPIHIAALISFGKATRTKMIQNFVWATGYNVVAIPLAAGVLYSEGILISPAIGAVVMSASTIIVAINAQLLRRRLRLHD